MITKSTEQATSEIEVFHEIDPNMTDLGHSREIIQATQTLIVGIEDQRPNDPITGRGNALIQEEEILTDLFMTTLDLTDLFVTNLDLTDPFVIDQETQVDIHNRIIESQETQVDIHNRIIETIADTK